MFGKQIHVNHAKTQAYHLRKMVESLSRLILEPSNSDHFYNTVDLEGTQINKAKTYYNQGTQKLKHDLQLTQNKNQKPGSGQSIKSEKAKFQQYLFKVLDQTRIPEKSQNQINQLNRNIRHLNISKNRQLQAFVTQAMFNTKIKKRCQQLYKPQNDNDLMARIEANHQKSRYLESYISDLVSGSTDAAKNIFENAKIEKKLKQKVQNLSKMVSNNLQIIYITSAANNLVNGKFDMDLAINNRISKELCQHFEKIKTELQRSTTKSQYILNKLFNHVRNYGKKLKKIVLSLNASENLDQIQQLLETVYQCSGKLSSQSLSTQKSGKQIYTQRINQTFYEKSYIEADQSQQNIQLKDFILQLRGILSPNLRQNYPISVNHQMETQQMKSQIMYEIKALIQSYCLHTNQQDHIQQRNHNQSSIINIQNDSHFEEDYNDLSKMHQQLQIKYSKIKDEHQNCRTLLENYQKQNQTLVNQINSLKLNQQSIKKLNLSLEEELIKAQQYKKNALQLKLKLKEFLKMETGQDPLIVEEVVQLGQILSRISATSSQQRWQINQQNREIQRLQADLSKIYNQNKFLLDQIQKANNTLVQYHQIKQQQQAQFQKYSTEYRLQRQLNERLQQENSRNKQKYDSLQQLKIKIQSLQRIVDVLQKQNEILKQDNFNQKIKVQEQNTQLQKNITQIEKLKTNIKDLNQNNIMNTAKIDELMQKQSLYHATYDKIQKNISNVDEQLKQSQKLKANYQAQCKKMQQLIISKDLQLTKLSQNFNIIQQEKSQIAKNNEQIQQQNIKLSKSIAILKEKQQRQTQRIKTLQQQRQVHQNQKAKQKIKQTNYENEIHLLKKNLKKVADQFQMSQTELLGQSTELESLKMIIQQRQYPRQSEPTTNKIYEQRITSLQNSLNQKQTYISELKAKSKQYLDQMNQLKKEIQTKDQEISKIRSKINQTRQGNISKSSNQRDVKQSSRKEVDSKLQKQLIELQKESFKRILKKHEKILTNIKQEQLDSLSLLYIGRLFQGELLQDRIDYKMRIISHIYQLTRRPITKTRLVYKMDLKNKTNFHEYIDNTTNLFLVVKTVAGAYLAGYYTGQYGSQVMMQAGILISITNNESYYLNVADNTTKTSYRAMVYDLYFLIFGNAELRIKTGEKSVFCNFGIMNSYFNHKGKKVNDFLCAEASRETEISSYEIYEIVCDNGESYYEQQK